jgi:hypothetical protein
VNHDISVRRAPGTGNVGGTKGLWEGTSGLGECGFNLG